MAGRAYAECSLKLNFESERLAYRPLEEADIDLVVEQWTDPEVAKYNGAHVYTERELREEMPLATRRCGGGCIGIWTVSRKSGGEKIGTAFLLPMPVERGETDWNLLLGDTIPDGDIEIGYYLKRSAWGRGYATEACGRLLRFAFEEAPLDVLVASIHPENMASRRVLEKNGVRYRGVVRSYGQNIPGFRITRSEWLENCRKGRFGPHGKPERTTPE